MKLLFENWRKNTLCEQGEKESGTAPRVLIFGHSQVGGIGRAQRSSLIAQGIPKKNITVRKHTGNSDGALARKIKKVKGKYTHAVLHLDGNTWNVKKPLGPDGPARFVGAKNNIINYVKNVLGVPEENIWIFVPPHNLNFRKYYNYGPKKYKKRYWGHVRALKYFNNSFPAAKVQVEVAKYPGSAFGDGLHLKGNSAGSAFEVRIA